MINNWPYWINDLWWIFFDVFLKAECSQMYHTEHIQIFVFLGYLSLKTMAFTVPRRSTAARSGKDIIDRRLQYPELYDAPRLRRQIGADPFRALFKAPCFSRVGFFEDPFSCNTYYHCMANGTNVRKTCLPPLQFSEERQMCMDPGTVDCPDIPDFWLYGAAAAAAAVNGGTGPTNLHGHHAHGLHHANSHHGHYPFGFAGPPPTVGYPHSSIAPPSNQNPFISSPLSVNSAPLTKDHSTIGPRQYVTPWTPGGQGADPQRSRQEQQSTWSNPFPGSQQAPPLYPSQRPPGYTNSNSNNPGGMAQNPTSSVPGRANPGEPMAPEQSLVIPGVYQHQPMVPRPTTSYHSAPLQISFLPEHLSQPAPPPAEPQPSGTQQMWLDLDSMSHVPAHNHGPPALPSPYRFSIHNTNPAPPPGLPSISSSQSQNNKPPISVLTLLNAQLGFDQAAPVETATPSAGLQPPTVARPGNLFLSQPTEGNFAQSLLDPPMGTQNDAPPSVEGTASTDLSRQKDNPRTCRTGEKGFFADIMTHCKGYYFCSPFGDRAHFSCPVGRFFSEKTVSCEMLDKSSCADMEFTRPNPTSLYSFLTPLPVNNAPPGMDQTPVTPPIPAMAGLDQALLPHLRSHEGASGQQTPSFLASPMESIAPPTNLMQAEGSELSPQLQSVDPTEPSLAPAITGAMQTTLQQSVPMSIPNSAPISSDPIFPTESTNHSSPTTHSLDPSNRSSPVLEPNQIHSTEKSLENLLEIKLRRWNMFSPPPVDPRPTATSNFPVAPESTTTTHFTNASPYIAPVKGHYMPMPVTDHYHSVTDGIADNSVEEKEVKGRERGEDRSETKGDTSAYQLGVAFYRQRDTPPVMAAMHNPPAFKPLRFADSSRTINLKLLAELLKG